MIKVKRTHYATKMIQREKYIDYENALNEFNLQDLKTKREKFNAKFANKCLMNENTAKNFPKRKITEELRNNVGKGCLSSVKI